MQYGLLFQTTIMRMFGIYGPGQKEMTIPSVMDRLRSHEEIVLAQGAGLYFTPLFIDDCVEMIRRLVKTKMSSGNEIVNIAGNEVVHLGLVVRLLSEQLRISPSTRLTDDAPMYLQGSNKKICRMLEYQPSVSFEAGIVKTIQ